MKAFFRRIVLLFFLFVSFTSYGQYSIVEIGNANGGCNGFINLYVDAAGGPHTFLWSNGTQDKNAIDLCPGNYSVTITNGAGCQSVLEGTVGGDSGCYIDGVTIEANIVHYCAPNIDGEIQIQLGNTERYNYNWSIIGKGATLSKLLPGTYCVTIEDTQVSNCFAYACYDVINENCDTGSGGPVIIINETSNGPKGSEEFVEILVNGDGSCNTVDIQG